MQVWGDSGRRARKALRRKAHPCRTPLPYPSRTPPVHLPYPSLPLPLWTRGRPPTFTSSTASAARSAAPAVIAGVDASKRRLLVRSWVFATAGRSCHRPVCALDAPAGKCSECRVGGRVRSPRAHRVLRPLGLELGVGLGLGPNPNPAPNSEHLQGSAPARTSHLPGTESEGRDSGGRKGWRGGLGSDSRIERVRRVQRRDGGAAEHVCR